MTDRFLDCTRRINIILASGRIHKAEATCSRRQDIHQLSALSVRWAVSKSREKSSPPENPEHFCWPARSHASCVVYVRAAGFARTQVNELNKGTIMYTHQLSSTAFRNSAIRSGPCVRKVFADEGAVLDGSSNRYVSKLRCSSIYISYAPETGELRPSNHHFTTHNSSHP
jgi:hypothetical protein